MSHTQQIPASSRSLTLHAFKQPLSFDEHPLSPPSSGTALVRILTTIVRPHMRGGFEGNSFLSFPVPYTPGFSAVGRVVAAGDDAVLLQPGQLVWVDGFYASRDDPENAKAIIGLDDGRTEKSKKLFNAWEGLFRDIARVPLENCHRLDESLSTKFGYKPADLQIIERLTVAYGGICAAKIKPGQTVVVAPATGQYSGSVAELAAQLGCRVIALTRSAAKLAPLTAVHPQITVIEVTGDKEADKAAILAASPPSGADAYIDISPPIPAAQATWFEPCISAVRPSGRVVFLGMLFDVTVNYASLLLRNITIKGQWMYKRQQAAELIRLIEIGHVKVGRAAGHEAASEFSFEDWEQATRAAEKTLGWGQQVLLVSREDRTRES